MTELTQEAQYQFLLERERQQGLETLGLMSSQVWQDDPRRLLFVLSRYKFVAKMFSGMGRVLEVGCADAFGSRVVRQEVPEVVATDFDPVFIRRNQARNDGRWNVTYQVHDMLAGPLGGDFDGAYAIDVLEHIPPEVEDRFLEHLARSIRPEGAVLLGSPSIHSQAYASAPSREGHVNCKDAPGMRSLLERHFHRVFLFSMNDEVVHTGFPPLAHYLWALGCHRKAT
ncbi:MAG: class I SAM-dependent methyltransferase [Verrucomicrobiae bacterium]|nr:class I SAM-dependent methyltransferase [Verrucomicrobiae bacterium]